MRSAIKWRLLLLLVAALTAATVLCSIFGISGPWWYAQPTVIVPAVVGILLALFQRRNSQQTPLAVTLFAAWTVAALISTIAGAAFVYSYNGEFEMESIGAIALNFLWNAVIGGVAGTGSFLLVAKAVRPGSLREAA